MKREAGGAEAGAGDRQRDGDGSRLVDDPRTGGFRGPLVFGVVAATIELAIILALMYC